MALEELIYQAVSPVLPIYPDGGVPEQEPPLPYATYFRAGGRVVTTLAKEEVPGLQHAHIQINIWASTILGASMLIREVDIAVRSSGLFQGNPLSSPSNIPSDDDAFGLTQDFGIWYGGANLPGPGPGPNPPIDGTPLLAENHLSEFDTETKKSKARGNIGLENIDGGTFN